MSTYHITNFSIEKNQGIAFLFPVAIKKFK